MGNRQGAWGVFPRLVHAWSGHGPRPPATTTDNESGAAPLADGDIVGRTDVGASSCDIRTREHCHA